MSGVVEGASVCRVLDERLREVRKRLREMDRRLSAYRAVEGRYREVQKRLHETGRRRVRPPGPDEEG